jgi:hypothetical protein
LLSVGPDPVVVERMLVGGELRCPDCGGVLARWGWAAARFVRELSGGVRRVRLRRGICVGAGVDSCGRSHVLLPRFLLGRRLDEVGLIWSVLVARAGGWGWRRAAELAGRPAATVRGWLARFADRARAIRAVFAELERLVSDGGGMDRLVPAGGPLPDAVAQVGACLAALRRSRGESVLTVSVAQVVAVLSGGWLLGSRPFRATGLWINTFPHL